jgi:ABC-type xylose transport system substrate-binding protein
VNKNNSIAAVYPSHTAAEAAIKELQQSGLDMKKLSVVGRDYPMDDTTHAKKILNRTKPETLEHHQ